MTSESRKVLKGISFIVIILIILVFIIVYRKNNFAGYKKSEYYQGKTSFTRDSSVKYSSKSSYKLQSKEYNDAIFYKKIKVSQNTPYRISCMVKTNNVELDSSSSIAGAHISVLDTTEKSKSLVGTSDWQKVELYIDSKQRDEIEIGFRLRRI